MHFWRSKFRWLVLVVILLAVTCNLVLLRERNYIKGLVGKNIQEIEGSASYARFSLPEDLDLLESRWHIDLPDMASHAYVYSYDSILKRIQPRGKVYIICTDDDGIITFVGLGWT